MKRKMTRAEWIPIIADFEKSGMTPTDYANLHKYKSTAFYTASRRYGSKVSAPRKAKRPYRRHQIAPKEFVTFKQVTSLPITVTYKGATIQVGSDDTQALQTVLNTIKGME